ncbi:hypothetical protein [Psychromicrobium sp. YIM B11713]|uniref:hypothetical protein n=1 Tax=Psychromicrobium sp. YIM B11713 TaxID=3145233 RepID=UPI00374ED334
MFTTKKPLQKGIAAFGIALALSSAGVTSAQAAQPAVAPAASVPTTVAPAIYLTNPFDCLADVYTGNAGYTIFIKRDPANNAVVPFCYAEAGATGVDVNWVWTVRTGNNQGAYTFVEQNGWGATAIRLFGRGEGHSYGDAIKVTSLTIL